MSWSSPRLGAGCALGAALLVLAACGYRPLYGERAGGGVDEDLATVRIESIADRPGQELRNLLLDRINPAGQPASPQYVLSVTLHESVRELGIRRDELSTRANLSMAASYSLRELATQRMVFAGESHSVASYNISREHFASFSSAEAARQRAVSELGEDIRARLAVYFNQRRAGQGG